MDYGYNAYNPYTQNLQNMYQYQQRPYQNQQRYEIIHVNGRGGAEALQMAPNSNIILMDDTAPKVWLKMTDGAGYPTLKGFKIIPDEEVQTDMSTLETRVKRLEELINGYQSNGNNAKRNKSDNVADKSTE